VSHEAFKPFKCGALRLVRLHPNTKQGAGRSVSISSNVLTYVRMQTEDLMIPRRTFLEIVTGSGVLAALGDLGFLAQLRSVSEAKVALEPRMGRFHPESEPNVRLIKEMPRNRVLEEVTRRVKHGRNYRELRPRLLLAGVRSIQPRPVGSEFHAVLVVNSAHLASLASRTPIDGYPSSINTKPRRLPMRAWATGRMGASSRLCSCVCVR
jgi:hypothetical protein